MGRWGRGVHLFWLAVLLIGCDQGTRRGAPTGPEDLGVLIQQASIDEVEAFISTHPHARWRPLNLQHGIYEIFGVTTGDVQAAFPDRSVPNVFIPLAAGPDFSDPSNPPFLGPHSALNLDLSLFTHLSVIRRPSTLPRRDHRPLVAVLDTGINYNHPELSLAISADAIGYDFIDDDHLPFDDVGHGTHVAGLLLARSFGVAPDARLLSVKIIGPRGGDVGSMAAGLWYAVDQGAHIVNISAGVIGPTAHPALTHAMDYALRKGVLVVAAAGNGMVGLGLGMDIDETPVYPASFAHENLLTVAAGDAENAISPDSNFGAKSVDLVAPGGFLEQGLWSLATVNPQAHWLAKDHGTSMATPLVAGAAALIWTEQTSAAELKQILLTQCRPIPELKAVTTSGCHLDVQAALSAVSH